MKRRVVVTGMGCVSPLGMSLEDTWKRVRAGESGIGLITHFDTSDFRVRIAGEVSGFDPLDHFDKREVKRIDRFIQFAIVASREALRNSGLIITTENAERVGVAVGSGIGGLSTIEETHTTMLERGPSRIGPFFIPGIIINLASGQISIEVGAKGPNISTVTACATGNHSIGESMRLIQTGAADAMICGGAEAAISGLAVGGFAAMKALSTRNDEPERASRPYDKDRDGFVLGEGSGVLVIEELGHARARGARILCEMVGYGLNGDAFHITAPSTDGDGAIRVMNIALRDAQISAKDVQYINAHGTSTPAGDVAECTAVRKVFGDDKSVAVSSTKSMTGHLLGAAGGLEAILTIMAVREQIAPPTINFETPDPDCDIDCVPNQARPMTIDYAMSNSFGFGGTNACLVFSRCEE